MHCVLYVFLRLVDPELSMGIRFFVDANAATANFDFSFNPFSVAHPRQIKLIGSGFYHCILVRADELISDTMLKYSSLAAWFGGSLSESL